MEQIIKISEFILKSFIHIWPYLLVTIPLAVVSKPFRSFKIYNQGIWQKSASISLACNYSWRIQSVLLMWCNSGDQFTFNWWRSACTGNVILDSITVNGS